VSDAPIRTEPARRRVRARLGGVTIADSTAALLLLERGHTPVYYFPRGDVRLDLMTPTGRTSHYPRKGDASY